MSNQLIGLNSIPNEPSLSDLLDLLKKEIFLDLNCHHIGVVQSFDSSTMTVTASIAYTKTIFQLSKQTQTYVPVQINYAPVLKAPIISLSGGPVNLTMPIAKGDECILVFNDRDMDSWFSSGQFGPIATGRLHSFTDAFCLVGIKSTPNFLKTYDTLRALLTNGNVALGINPSTNKVTIKNTSIGTLNSLLQSILSQLETLCTQTAAITVTAVSGGTGTSGPPSNAAAITAVSAQLSTLATQLGGLLE